MSFFLPQAFCPLRALDGAHPVGEDHLLYSADDSNANLFQKHPHKHTLRNNVLIANWAHIDLIKLTHKINHHTPVLTNDIK